MGFERAAAGSCPRLRLADGGPTDRADPGVGPRAGPGRNGTWSRPIARPARSIAWVDIFYVATHGGATDTNATLALRPVDTFTLSSSWRFGDNSNRIAIFSQYACATLRIDGKGFTRWAKAFKGGLYLATGSHGVVHDGWPTDDTGEDYADNLTHGKTVKWA
jgi:hypothetical protein